MMKERRKRYLVKKKLQFKCMFFVLFSMLIPTLVCSGALYYFIWQTVAEEIAVPEAIASSLIPALNRVNAIILIVIPIVFVAMILASVYLSHKIAGPIYRIEKELDEVVKGNYSTRIQFRSGDELQEIAHKINILLENLDHKG